MIHIAFAHLITDPKHPMHLDTAALGERSQLRVSRLQDAALGRRFRELTHLCLPKLTRIPGCDSSLPMRAEAGLRLAPGFC